ncbi:DUF4129 domain-containing protein [bacterium]|nr:MAG: DUF4129 domain-containing protein [bacterium]
MTSRLWRAISILFVVLSATLSHAQRWKALEGSIEGLPEAKAAQVLKRSPLVKSSPILVKLSPRDLIQAVRLRARIESTADPKDLKGEVEAIKAQKRILDGRTAQSANWLSKALSGLRREQETSYSQPKPSTTPSAPVNTQGVVYFMWFLLGLAVLFFLYFALRHLSGIKRRTVVKALVEEDEPERTVDEWLLQAQELESKGMYREAVRALYLACLLRLDEAGIARFIRHETNWEHQNRIDVSPKRPPTLDLRPATQLMDRVWYGFRTEGPPDVARIRGVYESILREAFPK